eukprot:g17836.t1
MGSRGPKDGWISSLEAVVRENPGTEVDQARLTATHFAVIFEERKKKELQVLARGGGNAKGRELPRFFVPPPIPTAHSPPDSRAHDHAMKSEESRVAAARSKLRAKARSRFLQRREDALMGFEDLSEVEQALATCVPPPPPPPPVATATTSPLETTRGGSDDGRTAATTATASVGGHGVEAGGDASQGDPAAANSLPHPNPFVATDARGGSADYMDFVRVRGMVSGKAAACFKPGTFLRFPRDIRARIPSRVFFKHVYESVTLQKTRLTLHFYDSEGLGFLREQDLENYVYDHIPTMPALRAIHDNFYPFYVFTAVRRFMFFLDPKRTGKISIDTLVRSRVMEELLQLRMAAGPRGSEAQPPPPPSGSQNPEDGAPSAAGAAARGGGGGGGGGGTPCDQNSHTSTAERSSGGGGGGGGGGGAESLEDGNQHRKGDSLLLSPGVEGGGAANEEGRGGSSGSGSGELPLQDLSKNWFSAENTLRVYGEYLELDEDQNGMLSKRELMNFGSRQRTRLTPVFVQRLFEEVVTYRVQPAPSTSTPSPSAVRADKENIRHGGGGGGGGAGGGGGGGSYSTPLPISPGDVDSASAPATAAAITDVPANCPASPPRIGTVSPTPALQGRSASPPLPPTSPSPPSSPSAAAAAASVAATRPCSLACPVPRTSAASRSSLLALSSTRGGVRTPSPTRPNSPGAGAGAATAEAAAAAAGSPPRSPVGGVVGISTPPHGSAGSAAVSGGDTGRCVTDEHGVGGKGGGGGVERKAAPGEAQMDYKTFLDFVLAMENKQTRQAMHYFWRVLDAHGEGRLTVTNINLFVRDVTRALREGGFETPNTEDVKDEIFDMVKPADPAFITLADLLLSGAGHTVVSMLVDVNGFWTYDNRESLAT